MEKLKEAGMVVLNAMLEMALVGVVIWFLYWMEAGGGWKEFVSALVLFTSVGVLAGLVQSVGIMFPKRDRSTGSRST